MTARLRAGLEALGDQFWLRPALIILLGLGLGQAAIWLEDADLAGRDLSSGSWGYSGGAEGARALLSTVASSTIGVAGTTFSITIAALSLASGQMGPRLLRNFVRDGRNQIALGIFLGTFAYALIVLRTVRTVEETQFVPHLAVTGAIVLALLCLGTLVWFVHHIATSINVETVVDEVHHDLCKAIDDRTLDEADVPLPALPIHGQMVGVTGSQFLQAIDTGQLADYANERGVSIRLRVRPGDYVPCGAPVAEMSGAVEGASEALDRALTFGRRAVALQDLEYSIRQLSEIAVRALSPGINDPFTAASVVERLGDALGRIAPRHLRTGAVERGERIVLVHPVTDYAGLCDAMFHLIRQNAAGSAYVLIRMLEVLSRVAEVERLASRRLELRRHAELIMASVGRSVTDRGAQADAENRYEAFLVTIAS